MASNTVCRRSCRILVQKVKLETQDDKDVVKRQRSVKKLIDKNNNNHIVPTKRIKIEKQSFDIDTSSKPTNHSRDEQHFNKPPTPLQSTPNKVLLCKQSPKADGFLEVDSEELDLEPTLLGGQSFRWTKETSSDNHLIFTGILLNHVLKIWRISDSKIAYKKVNKDFKKGPNIGEVLKDYFQLNYNLKELYQVWSERDEHLAKCCRQYKGFRILRQDPVENVFSFICATNNNIKRISQMVEKLCKRYGDILDNRDDEPSQSVYDSYHSFPPVERLAQDDVFECLRHELGFGYRAKYITGTAKELLRLSEDQKRAHYNSPHEYLLSLRALSYKETCRQLMKLHGVGRKVADCICLMSMDHLNAVPIDCHIYEIFCRNYMPNLKKERKSLTEGLHDFIGEYFADLHGPLAGWSTSVLFISELKHLKTDERKRKKKEEDELEKP